MDLNSKQIEADQIDFASNFEQFEMSQVEGAFNAILMEFQGKADVIKSIIDTDKPAVARQHIQSLICEEVVWAANGRLTVTEYNQKASAKQNVYIFVSTHWVFVRHQQFFDFVRNACKKLGVPGEYCNHPKFMNEVFEQISFMVSADRRQNIPGNEVWINLLNGTLKININGTNTFTEHNRDEFFTYVLPYSYEADAKCPLWHKFLDQVLPDKDAQLVLAEFIGYCFTHNLKLEKMAVFYGIGSNGKSVTLDVIEALMGKSNVSNMTLSAVTTDPEKRSHIEHKLANISHESGKELDPSMMKQLSSGEPTEVRVLYQGTHIMYEYAKFITSYNQLPPTESTHGFFRRWLIIPFDKVIKESEQDVDLSRKLINELPGILNWALEALKGLLQRRRFTESAVCREALNNYKRSANTALQFLDERCVIDDNERMAPKDVFYAYKCFCNEEGNMYPMGKKKFYESIIGNGVKVIKSNGVQYANIKFKEPIF